jgi:hypothetical protein
MPFYGPLTIGRLTLTEDFVVKETGGSTRSLQVSGQESWPPLPDAATVRYRGEQLMAMEGQIVPVLFTSKSDRNGFYTVDKPSVTYTNYDNNISVCDWSVNLVRLGNDAESFFESRLIGGNRISYYGGNVAERWHSPAGSNQGYYTGANVPSSMIRSGSEGPITIYRGLDPTTSPRWGSTPENYMRGAARVTVNGLVRTGLTCPNTPLDWSMDNSFLKVGVDADNATFKLWHYVGGIYSDTYSDSYGGVGSFLSPRSWVVDIQGVAAGGPLAISILKNEPEECITRVTYQTVQGYSTIDYSLKRGSRFVSIFAQHADSAVFTVFPQSGTPASDSGQGWIRETSNDADGNRYVLGSATQINVNTSGGSIENVDPALSFACFVGKEIGGADSVDGDQAPDLAAQYLGSPSEVIRGIRR